MLTQEEVTALLENAIAKYCNAYTLVRELIDLGYNQSDLASQYAEYYAAQLEEARSFSELRAYATVLNWDSGKLVNRIQQGLN